MIFFLYLNFQWLRGCVIFLLRWRIAWIFGSSIITMAKQLLVFIRWQLICLNFFGYYLMQLAVCYTPKMGLRIICKIFNDWRNTRFTLMSLLGWCRYCCWIRWFLFFMARLLEEVMFCWCCCCLVLSFSVCLSYSLVCLQAPVTSWWICITPCFRLLFVLS